MTTPVRTLTVEVLRRGVEPLRHPHQAEPAAPLFALDLAEAPTRIPDAPHPFPWPALPKRAKWSWIFRCGCVGVALDDYRVGLVTYCRSHALTPAPRDMRACPNCTTGRLVTDPTGTRCPVCAFVRHAGRLD